MATGGTLAPPAPGKATPQPGGRKTAAAVALGAPKTSSVTRAKASAPAKMPKTAKAPAKLPRAQGAKQPAQAKAPRTVPNYTEGVLSGEQIKNIAHNEAQEVLKAELAPLKGEGREISQNEQGASERYQQYSGAANELLSNVAGAQQTSAKTFENQAADNALQAGKAVETAGQTQASMTGGYVSPELKAQLNAEATREAGVGAANNTFAQSSAAAGSNLIQGMRSAAALRSVEGQDKLTGYFQKEASKVGEDENSRVAKVGADQADYEQKIGSENAKQYVDLRALGIKQSELGNKTQLDQSKIGRESVENQASKAKIQSEGVKNQVSLAKLGLEGEKEQATQKRYEAEDKENEASAKEKLAKTADGGVTTDTELKLVGEVSSAYGTVEMLRANAKKAEKEGKPPPTPQQIRQFIHIGADVEVGKSKVKVKAVSNPTLVNAAVELYYYHTVSPATAAALKAAGINRTPAELATAVGI
jgi:hypothetical protein